MNKLNKFLKHAVISITIVLIMSFFMSLFLTLVNVGIDGFEVTNWLKEWGIAFILALALSAIVTSVVPLVWIKIFKKFESKDQSVKDIDESNN